MVIDIIADRQDAILDTRKDDWNYDKAKKLYDAAEDTSIPDLCYAVVFS